MSADGDEPRRMSVLAEREGFEPPIRLPVCRISSAVLSTAQPPLRGAEGGVFENPAAPGLCNEAAGARQGGLMLAVRCELPPSRRRSATATSPSRGEVTGAGRHEEAPL